VDEVIGDEKVGHVSVHIHRFTVAGPQVINLVAADRDGIEGSGRSRAVDGDAKSVPGGFRGSLLLPEPDTQIPAGVADALEVW